MDEGVTDMRLIDADEAKKNCERIANPYSVMAAKAQIDSTETIDAVSVVRCSQCEKWQKKEESWLCKNFGYCTECMMDCPADHFCSYGERKDGEG